MRIRMVPIRAAILIVDDDPAVREAVAAALADRYIVYTAASGADALTVLRAHPVAGILLDAVLQNEHGLDLIRHFRAVTPARIVLLTGHGSKELVVQALWARVDGYVEKPVSVAGLCAALDAIGITVPAALACAERARRALDDHTATHLRMADLAQHFGVSQAQLRRHFGDAYGKTPRRYWTEVRIRRAAELLRTTDCSVKEVTAALGFSSALVFRRTFQRILGLTPGAYRKSRHPGRALSATDVPPPAVKKVSLFDTK